MNLSFQHKWGRVCPAFLILLKGCSAQRLLCYRFLDLYIQGRTKQKPNILAKGCSELQTSFRRSISRNKWPTFNCLLNFSSTCCMIATTDSQAGANRPAKVGLIFTDWLSGGFGEEICLNPLTSRYFQIWGMPLPLCWSRWIKSKLSCTRVQRHLENKPLFIIYWMTAFMELSGLIF